MSRALNFEPFGVMMLFLNTAGEELWLRACKARARMRLMMSMETVMLTIATAARPTQLHKDPEPVMIPASQRAG